MIDENVRLAGLGAATLAVGAANGELLVAAGGLLAAALGLQEWRKPVISS